MLYQYSRGDAEGAAVIAFDDEFEACLPADVAEVEAETRRLLDIEGTLGAALGVAEFD